MLLPKVLPKAVHPSFSQNITIVGIVKVTSSLNTDEDLKMSKQMQT